MSRIVLAPVSGSLSHTTSRIVTFRGTAKVIPRSWHSSTSYLSFSPTGSSQVSQVTGPFSFRGPHFRQWISRSPRGAVWRVAPQQVQGPPNLSRPPMPPHSPPPPPLPYPLHPTDQP